MPRRSRTKRNAATAAPPEAEALHKARLDWANDMAEHLAAALRVAKRDVRKRGLSAIAPAGWPVLHEASRAEILLVIARLRQGWAENRPVEITAAQAQRLAHWLECLSLLARTEWAMAATGPLGPVLIRATAGANGNRHKALPDDPKGGLPSPI